MGLSRQFLTFFNFLTMVAGLGILGAGLWMKYDNRVKCLSFLEWYVIGLGTAVFLVALVGMLGSCHDRPLYLYVHLFVMFVLIIVLAVLIILSFLTTLKGHGHDVRGRGYDEYRIGDYSTWLQKRVNSTSNWRRVERCLNSMGMCRDVRNSLTTRTKFYNANLSPLESGCCKPPDECGFSYQNATVWVNPTNLNASVDCTRWSNQVSRLCFNCYSCRAGVIQSFKQNWVMATYALVGIWGLMVIVYIFDFIHFRHAIHKQDRKTFAKVEDRFRPNGDL